MKKYLIASILIIPRMYPTYSQVNLQPGSGQDLLRFGHSFMFTRPVFANTAMENAMWHNFIYDKEHCLKGVSQATFVYQRSLPSEFINHYFLLPCKTTLLVAGDNTADKLCRDIRAEWINLPSDFSGTMCINPSQVQIGALIQYNQDLAGWFGNLLEGYWVDFLFPIVFAQNTMNLRQNILNPGTPAVGTDMPRDIIEAFQQPSWQFGKIVNKRTKVELATIMVRLGKTYHIEDRHQFTYYTGLTFPTSSGQNPEYLFDPITGYNGHMGINAGVHFNVLLTRDCDSVDCYLFLMLDDIFLVRNVQCRTVGLRNNDRCPKLLSRFIAFNKPNCPTELNIPGVNVLTRRFKVRPYNMVDFAAGLRFVLNNWELEIGYELWGHGQEQLFFRKPYLFHPEVGIAGPVVNGVVTSASQSTIAQQSAPDPVFTPLDIADLEFKSATTYSALNNKVFNAISYKKLGHHADFFCAAGWYLEFPQKNGALKTAGAWAKVGSSF